MFLKNIFELKLILLLKLIKIIFLNCLIKQQEQQNQASHILLYISMAQLEQSIPRDTTLWRSTGGSRGKLARRWWASPSEHFPCILLTKFIYLGNYY